VEFLHFHGISRNFAEVENSAAINTISDLMTYFYHRKNQNKLPKAVRPTNSYHNMAQSLISAMRLDKLHF